MRDRSTPLVCSLKKEMDWPEITRTEQSLRSHLLGCRECRGSMQDLRALEHWFEAGRTDGAALVPPGFAARVARRAFAGDTGVRELVPSLDAARERRRMLDFVLVVTAAAAAVVLALAIGLRVRELPGGDRLRAEDRTPLTYEDIVRRLDELDANEGTLVTNPADGEDLRPIGDAPAAAPEGSQPESGDQVDER